MPKVLSTQQKNERLAKEGKVLKHYGVKYLAIPSDEQLFKLNQSIGCARFVFNFYLSERKEVYERTGKTLDVSTFKKAMVQLKKHPLYTWLANVDKYVIENAILDVNTAFQNFFSGRSGYPKYKSKRSAKQSYSTDYTNGNIKVDLENETIQIPKVGLIKIRMSKQQKLGFAGRILSATLTKKSTGQWFIALNMEEVVNIKVKPSIEDISDDDILAADLGLTHFLIDSKGNKVENPKFYRKSLKKLATMQKKLSKMVKGSQNYEKQKKKIAKLHTYIANMRKDFLHKESRKMIDENQVIILEDLHVKHMIKNRKLAKSIQDVGWGMFKQFIAYKANWAGKTVVFIDQWFPSSKLCGGCNTKNTFLSLNDRQWICPACGMIHDRDINAAKNIKKEGIRLLKQSNVA